MATDSAAAWVPTTDAEKAMKKAFDDLNASLDKGILRTDAGVPARFILHSKGYADLKAYVETGQTFPTTNDAFDQKISKDAFKKLADVDPDIYMTTRDTLVSIGSTCTEFAKDHLSSLVSVAQEAVLYSTTATSWLSEMDNLHLRGQLEILLNPKYTSPDKQDDAYKTALDIANTALTVLREDALEKKKATKAVLEALLTFQTTTMRNQTNVDLIIQQYETGPVKPNAVTSEPFLDYLNKDLAQQRREVERLIVLQDSALEAWKIHTGLATGLLPIPLVGWISAAVNGGLAATRRKDYNFYVEEVQKQKDKNMEEYNLIKFMSSTVVQCRDIDKKMKEAITAMRELYDLFSNQAACYDGISSTLLALSVGVKQGSLMSRKIIIESTLKSALQKLQDLKKVAQEFVNNAVGHIDVSQ